MKKVAFLSAFLIAIACNQPAKSYSTSKKEFDPEVEKQAILKTIEGETESFYKRDYEAWKENFVQKDYVFQAWTNPDGSFEAKVGWNEVDKRTGAYIKSNPVETGKSNHPWVERRNMVIKFFSENLAYLVWDQYNSDRESKTFQLSKDQRIMEKINGKWKIANVSSYWDYKNIIPADSVHNL